MVYLRDNMTVLLNLSFFPARGYPRGASATRPRVVSGYSSAYLGIQVAPDINGLFYWPGRIFSPNSGLKCLYSDLSQMFCSLDMGANCDSRQTA
jgi:hypothetical protein